MQVKVEPKTSSGGFGSSLPREKMDFSDFVDRVQAEKGENLYLTTQYRDEEDEKVETEEEADILEGMLHEYCPPPLPPMLKHFPHRPALLGNLVPQQVNVWIGSSKDGSSSGLHHDFHDNLYLLLSGKKRFTIFSPADANSMYTHGKIRKVHENGLINYANREPTRSDGASEEDLVQHKIEQLEAMLDNMEEAAISGPEKEEIEKQLAEARETILDLIEDPFGDDNDDFDELIDDFANDDFVDSFDDESEEEEKVKKTKSNGKASNGSGKKAKNSKDGKKKKKHESSEEELEEDDDNEDFTGFSLPPEKEEPNSFSKITVQELHGPVKDISKKYPLFSKAKRCTVELKAGEMLFLPTGWFHEVTSFNDSNAKTTPHVAFNYWMHPPATKSFEQPYQDSYWQSIWKQMVELMDGMDVARSSDAKRSLPHDDEAEVGDFIPKRKKNKE